MHMKSFDKMILLVFQKTSQTFYEIISIDQHEEIYSTCKKLHFHCSAFLMKGKKLTYQHSPET